MARFVSAYAVAQFPTILNVLIPNWEVVDNEVSSEVATYSTVVKFLWEYYWPIHLKWLPAITTAYDSGILVLDRLDFVLVCEYAS